MADPLDPFAQNIRGVGDLVQNKTNKLEQGERPSEGLSDEKIDVLSLEMDDKELLALRDKWEANYAPYEAKYKDIPKKNKESYLGKRADGQWLAGDDHIAANIQFESEETFLAAAMVREPDPVVYSDNSPEGNAVATDVKTMLRFHADQLSLRRKLQYIVRQWSIYHLGVLKYGWNQETQDVEISTRKIQNFIFDPNGYVDTDGRMIGYVGERISVPAEEVIELFPQHKEYIANKVEQKLGTEITYTEWWTDEYTFSTYEDIVLDKHKNNFYNYEEPQEGTDEFGLPLPPIQKRNHYAVPIKPYTFLSVYSLQEQPHDITGLIEQNIPNQRRIAKKTSQIDINTDQANNGLLFSEDNFNQETAKQAANALTRGPGKVLVPSGRPIAEAVQRLQAPDLPSAIFNSLEEAKNDLRSSWGIQGITSQPADEDQTARGMILNQQHDTSRIGGGIGEAVEVVAKSAFNWLVQMYLVFYDEPHFAAIMGTAKAVEYVTLSSQNIDRQLIVTVAPDSLKPKDEVNQMNLAMSLFQQGVIGPKTLLKMQDFPDADNAAADGMLYKLDPMSYFQLNFPQYAAQLQAQQQQAAMIGGAIPQPMSQPSPEAQTEPQKQMTEPASASLNQVPLPPEGGVK